MTRVSLRRTAASVALLLSLALLFLIANRAAYQGYFHGDDFDNLALVSLSSADHFLKSAFWLRVGESNERAVGFLAYTTLWKLAGLQFPCYVAALQALHGVTAGVLFFWLRHLGAGLWPALAATLFWAFHAAILEVWWRPMFLFDLLGSLFGLLCLLAYSRRAYFWSFLFLWLAFRAKEPGLMVAGVLVGYELLYGEKKWRRVAPFLLAAVALGVHTLSVSVYGAAGTYRRTANFGDLWEITRFYSSRLLHVPYAGLALPAGLWLWRDRLVMLGLAQFALLLAPMFLLPERLQSAYLYGPLTGVAMVLAGLAGRLKRRQAPILLAALLLWAPWNHGALRQARRAILAAAEENRAFVAQLIAIAKAYPTVCAFVFEDSPPQLNSWGVRGVLTLLRRSPVELYWAYEQDATLPADQPILLVGWAPGEDRITVVARREGDLPLSYLAMNRLTPVWQLREGWLGLDRVYRWARPRATARLWRPPEARAFALSLYTGADYLGECSIQVWENGALLGAWRLTKEKAQTLRLELPARAAAVVDIEFRFQQGCRLRDHADPLGAPITGFGYLE